jgi:iron(III) transport system substrate-binding protein
VTEPVAILSTAQNPDAAKAFVDFLLSPEGQQLAADQGYLPAHPAIDPLRKASRPWAMPSS